jgi:hypothetical protein
VSAKTLPRHARPVAMGRWADRLAHRGLAGSPAGTQPPRPRARRDALAGPVAITEHCVIGDQIRVPAARCDMTGCTARFADPGALGEADNRAKALAAGWRADPVGRLVCPECQQCTDAAWPQPGPGHGRDPGGGTAPADASPRPAGRSVRAIMARWRTLGTSDRRWAQCLYLLAALASASNGWDAPQPLTVLSQAKTHQASTTATHQSGPVTSDGTASRGPGSTRGYRDDRSTFESFEH